MWARVAAAWAWALDFRCAFGLILLLACPGLAAAAETHWELRIEGEHRLVFGEPVLNGSIRIPWRVVLRFTEEDGWFRHGQGRAEWLQGVTAASEPPGWIRCKLHQGSYLDAGLHLRELPHIRFDRFPLAGRIDEGAVSLRPGYDIRGNYLAVSYHCETDNPSVSNWFLFAERARNEEGKQQDADKLEIPPHREALVREVKPLPPLGIVRLPLQDGWFFEQGDEEADFHARWSLHRIEG